MKLKIAVDSGSNYRKIDNINYSIAPLSIHTDECEFNDTHDLIIDDMLEYLEHTKLSSHSSCPGIHEWMKCFEGSDNIIAITLAGALSGCFNACQAAASQYKDEHPNVNIYPLDTHSIGPVEKLCVEYVIEHSDIEDFDELTQALTNYCFEHTKIGFCLKSLKNLANNGRINSTVAQIATALGIHIIGDFSPEGELVPQHKTRGDKKSMQTLYKDMLGNGYNGQKLRIDHCKALDTANMLAAFVKADYPAADIHIEETTGLCSFYAERGGIVIGYEI